MTKARDSYWKGRKGSRKGPSRKRDEDSLRASAVWVLERTLASGAPVGSFISGVSQRFDRRDRALLEELVFGSLRWLRRLDQVIESASNRRLNNIDSKLIGILRVATYQLLFLDRIPAHAAVNEAVEQTRRTTHKGGVSFVNAVLRRIARDPQPELWPVKVEDPVGRLAVEGSHPDFLVQGWLENYGEDRTRDLIAANNTPRPIHLLAFRHRGGRELLAETLIDEGIQVEPSRLSPLGLVVAKGNVLDTEAFRQGMFYIQDEVSQVVALLMPPREEERILDIAAAPGGKSFSIKAWENATQVLAGDRSLSRLLIMRDNCRRLQLPLSLAVIDGSQSAYREESFDRVVLDLPCSGTGTLRKHPEIKWNLKSSDFDHLAAEALLLLEGSAPLVRSGGHLVAITCSLEEKENDRVIQRFLEGNAEFFRDPWTDLPSEWEAMDCGEGKWQCLPGDDHDGFTVHRLRKNPS